MLHLVPPLRTALASTLVVALSSCGLFRTVVDAPASVARNVLPGGPDEKLMPVDTLHPRLLGLADSCVARVRSATELFEVEAATEAAALQALQWRLRFTRAAYLAATGPSPLTGLLDLVVIASTSKVLLRSNGIEAKWGAPSRHIVAAIDSLDATCWDVVDDYIGREQIAELKATLTEWQQKTLTAQTGELDELPDFRQVAHSLGKTDAGKGGGLMNFLTIDPLAGIEPVAREVALTRQFAERMLFWAERMPTLVDDQVELATVRARSLPEVTTTLAAVDRASRASESIATTASLLTDDLSKERKAALEQFAAVLDAQRTALLRDLSEVDAPVNSMLAESRTTLAAGKELAAELTNTAAAVDAMLKRFDKDPNEPPAPPAPDGKPFDIVEYGDTAERVGAAAKELRETIRTIDEALPKVDASVEAAIARLDASIESAFQKGLYIGLALLTAGATAVLAVRMLSSRISARPSVRS